MWFGEPWPSPDRRAPVCQDDSRHVETPVGEPCLYCTVEIHDGDGGAFVAAATDGPGGWPVPMSSPVHRECILREVIGGAGHLAAAPHPAGTCEPDGGLSRYRSALLVQKWVDEMGLENVLYAAQFKQVRDHLQREIEAALIEELLDR